MYYVVYLRRNSILKCLTEQISGKAVVHFGKKKQIKNYMHYFAKRHFRS